MLYYFDIDRRCEVCDRPFLFFAEEQKHWYETLGFNLSAMCLRCVECRKEQQGLERSRRRFEELVHRERTGPEDLEMASCILDLVEAEVFHPRQKQRVRATIRSLERDCAAAPETLQGLRSRVLAIESGSQD